ncbi:MAG: RecX family transcriptional regulator [Bacteroidaceae bacterium]|nr:RecX family transcriptional regulator [Bacteroidaceae bacterium]
MKELSESEALNKAAAYCTLCERCTLEVCNKLDSWGVQQSVQQRIVERLKNEGFINENRYCRAFVNDKLRFNHWGKIKITAALREKRVPDEYITEALAQIDEDEYLAVLSSVIANKQKELNGATDYATQQKIVRHAASRGFEPSLIIKIVKYAHEEMDF